MVQKSNLKTIYTLMCFLLFAVFFDTSGADKPVSVQKDLNDFFSEMDKSFTELAQSSALKSTNLRTAERLFMTTLKQNRNYFTLIRTNSNGIIITEAVRSLGIERPMRNISSQSWFQHNKNKNEDYYSLIKDNDQGRYYLFWSKPILKSGRFVGSVLAKIDLWDSFYEFSNTVYYPFEIKLKNFRLFSHKWEENGSAKEENLTVPGIDRISVKYAPEKEKVAEPIKTDTLVKAISEEKVSQEKDEKGKGKSSPILPILLILFLAITVTGITYLIIQKKKRQQSIFDMIENDE